MEHYVLNFYFDKTLFELALMNVLLDTLKSVMNMPYEYAWSYLTLISLTEIFALIKIYFLVMNRHHCCATSKNTTTPVPPFPKDQEVHILH